MSFKMKIIDYIWKYHKRIIVLSYKIVVKMWDFAVGKLKLFVMSLSLTQNDYFCTMQNQSGTEVCQ